MKIVWWNLYSVIFFYYYKRLIVNDLSKREELYAIIELLHVLSKNKIKNINILGQPGKRKFLVDIFYEKVMDGSISSDKEAAMFFYQEPPSSRKYKDLKRRFFEKIKNTLLFIDVSESAYDDSGRAYYRLWKEFAISKVISGKGGNKSLTKLLEKLLRDSIKYDFTEISLLTARSLRTHSATVLNNRRKFKKYDDLCTKLQVVNNLEMDAESMFFDLLGRSYRVRDHERVAFFDDAVMVAAKIKALIDIHSTYKLNLFFYIAQLLGVKILGNNTEAESVCHQALAFFKTKPNYSKNAIGIFQRQLFLLYWQQQKYNAGEDLLQESKRYTRDGDLSFFTNHAYYFLLCMHAKEYEKALDVYTEVNSHRTFKTLSAYSRERWALFGAYLNYLSGQGYLPTFKMTTFRINKFLNEVPIFSKDKCGANIAILTIQMLLLLLYRRYNEVIDRAEALDKYAQRYLRQPTTLRSYYFIKMLLTIPLADFHQQGVLRKAQPFQKKLVTVPFSITRQAYMVEIIPYEHLWQYAIDSLDNTFWHAATNRSSR